MKITLKTQGHSQFIDITDKIQTFVKDNNINNGIVFIFSLGSTAGLTTMEFEPGVQKDIKSVLEKIIPENYDWQHHQRWGDKNGAAHIKAALLKPSLFIPFENKQLCLGTWQQIVFMDFDNRPRTRTLILKIIPST